MRNDRLAAAMRQAGVSQVRLAAQVGVDPKTVERWISSGRTPHPRHRDAVAAVLERSASSLWDVEEAGPETLPAELVAMYPDRASVPRATWLGLLSTAEANVDVLVMSGTFFAQSQPRIAEMLTARAAAGVRVRMCFGHPDGSSVALRDREEGLGGAMAAKVRASLSYYRTLPATPGCEVRLHDSTLYNSLFRYDGDIVVNPHVYGQPASLNPAFQLRQVPGGVLFAHYVSSFQSVWDSATIWDGKAI